MKLQTKVNIDKMGVLIRPDSKMCFLGSCFATHIGTRMIEVGLNAHVNPFGVLYNSILYQIFFYFSRCKSDYLKNS